MSETPLRVLFCIGINQNFFDLPADGVAPGDVWTAFVAMMDGIKAMDGVDFIGDIDDDSHLVGPSDGWPWTCYLLADVDSAATVKACCNLFREIGVGSSDFKLWRYAKVEARMGRALTPPGVLMGAIGDLATHVRADLAAQGVYPAFLHSTTATTTVRTTTPETDPAQRGESR